MRDKASDTISNSKSVCLFGGAFDPIHKGHTFIANRALETFELDSLIFIPTKIAPHKDIALTSFLDRAKMVELAIMNSPKFAISYIEDSFDGKSYTLNTVRALKQYNDSAKYFFLTGSDIFATIKTWFSYEMLLDEIRFIVIQRCGEEAMLTDLESEILDRVDYLNIETPKISSTDLRNNLEGNRAFLDESVYKYIIEKELYKNIDM